MRVAIRYQDEGSRTKIGVKQFAWFSSYQHSWMTIACPLARSGGLRCQGSLQYSLAKQLWWCKRTVINPKEIHLNKSFRVIQEEKVEKRQTDDAADIIFVFVGDGFNHFLRIYVGCRIVKRWSKWSPNDQNPCKGVEQNKGIPQCTKHNVEILSRNIMSRSTPQNFICQVRCFERRRRFWQNDSSTQQQKPKGR